MTNLKQIENVVKEFNNDEMAIQKELKRIQSVKCRLKKQKGKSTYEKEMTEALKYEKDTLKEFIGFKYNPLISFNGKKECLKFICLNNVIKVLLARNGQRVSSLIAGIAY